MIWIQSEKSFGTFLVAIVCRGHEKKHPKTLPLFLFEKKIENLEKKKSIESNNRQLLFETKYLYLQRLKLHRTKNFISEFYGKFKFRIRFSIWNTSWKSSNARIRQTF